MKLLINIFFPFLLSLFTLFSFLFIDQNFTYITLPTSGFHTLNRLTLTITYFLFVLLFFIAYWFLLFLIQNKKIEKKDVISLLPLVFLLLVSYPAMLSFDIFNYIATAKVSFFYKENPYIIMPIQFLDDPILRFTRAINKIALYGPVWVGLTGIPFVLGFGIYLLTLINFKIMVGLFFIGTCILIWKITKNIYSLSIFAFHPLVLIEILVSGHNDIVMMFFVLLSYFLLMRKRIYLAIFFFLLSVGIKYATIILLPIFLYLLINTGKNKQTNWDRIFLLSAFAMTFVMLLAPFREEIYPWYGIWILVFIPFIYKNKVVFLLFQGFSIGLLLSYIPYMNSGTYSGFTPYLKTGIMLFSCSISCLYLLWSRQYGFFKK